MDARYRLVPIVAGTVVLLFLPAAFAQYPRSMRPQQQQQYRATTEHFEVVAPDPQLCNRVAQEAERFRKELAIEWTGSELPEWRERCPILVELGMHAGGETSFAFVDGGTGKGVPVGWQMKIFGPPDRLLDAVLPHEITHTIFATYFGRPLPRWADEGACTTVEHVSEKQKNHDMLMDFLHATPSGEFHSTGCSSCEIILTTFFRSTRKGTVWPSSDHEKGTAILSRLHRAGYERRNAKTSARRME